MVNFAVQMQMDQEEWEDHVLGSGALSWSWWYQVERVEDGIILTWYDDVDNSEETVSKHLTWQEIADACSELAAKNPFVAAQLANSDFDAVGMDSVLQYAFMGEIIYG